MKTKIGMKTLCESDEPHELRKHKMHVKKLLTVRSSFDSVFTLHKFRYFYSEGEVSFSKASLNAILVMR